MKPRNTIISATLVSVAILAIGWVFYLTLGEYDPQTFQELHAPTAPLSISKDAPLVIKFPRPEKQPKGIIVYVADETDAETLINAHIRTSKGVIVAKKYWQHTYFPQSGAPAIQILFTPGIFPKNESFELVISPSHKEKMALLSNAMPEDSIQAPIVLSIIYKEPISLNATIGIIIGTFLGISFVLLHYVPIRTSLKWILVHIIVLACSIATLYPYLSHGGLWGINDWDYRYSLGHIYSATIREYHQVPFWNPYICGGAAGLGDPEFSLITPYFLFQFLLGEEVGTGISIVLCFIITGLGAVRLAKTLQLPPLAALLSAIIVLFSSALLLKTAEGHTTIIFAFMWIPWVFFAWLKAYRALTPAHVAWTFLCGIFLTLALLQGGIYILSYTALAFAAFIVLANNKKKACSISAFAGIWMLGLGSFQLIPTLFWLKQFPDQAFVGSTYTYTKLWDIFFGRYTQGVFVLKDQLSLWHEYGAYIGYGTLACILLGISYVKEHKIVRVLIFGMIITLAISSIGPLLEPILAYIPFIPRSNISRLVIFSVLCGGILAGFGIKRVLSLQYSYHINALLILLGFISIDLISLAYPIAKQGFVIPPITENIPQTTVPISHLSEMYEFRHQGRDVPRSYGAILKGYGTSSFCAVLGPKNSVITTSAGKTSPAYLSSTKDTIVKLLHWSPNTIRFSYSSEKDTTVTLNTNYAKGWYSDYGTVKQNTGLVSIELPPATHKEVSVSYSPPGLIVGVLISASTLVFATIFFLKRKLILQ